MSSLNSRYEEKYLTYSQFIQYKKEKSESRVSSETEENVRLVIVYLLSPETRSKNIRLAVVFEFDMNSASHRHGKYFTLMGVRVS